MPSPSSTIPLSLALSGWWPPVLGLLMAGLGVALVTVAVGDLVAPVRATRSIVGAMVAIESIRRVPSRGYVRRGPSRPSLKVRWTFRPSR